MTTATEDAAPRDGALPTAQSLFRRALLVAT